MCGKMKVGESKKITVTGCGLEAMKEVSKEIFVSNKNPFAWFRIKNIKMNDEYEIIIKKLRGRNKAK